MYYVYFIKSQGSDFLYIGSTPDLKRRFNEHNAKKVRSTKCYVPFKLIYYEAYKSKRDAINREKSLKKFGSAYGHLKKRLKESIK